MGDQPDTRGIPGKIDVLEEFATRARMVARQSFVDAAAAEALDALEVAGVEAILLKGIVLARTLYHPDEHRGYYDVDLLVAPGNLVAAGVALTNLGYQNFSEMRGLHHMGGVPGQHIDDVARTLHAEVWSRLVPAHGNMLIDLHWRLDGCEAPPGLVWNTLYANRAAIELRGRRVSTLARPALAVHLALHAAQHGEGDPKAVGDLRRGLERWQRDDWSRAEQLARELGATNAFAAGLRLLPHGVALTRELGLPAIDVRPQTMTRVRGMRHLEAFNEARSTHERLAIMRASLVPTRAWIKREYRWAAQGTGRLLAAYAIHAGRTPGWVVRLWSLRRKSLRQKDQQESAARCCRRPM